MTKAIIFLSKAFKKTGLFLEKLAQSPSYHNSQVQQASAKHDMAKHPDEVYYAKQYLYHIQKALEKFKSAKIKAIDIGCGQGRLSIPLAQWCTEMIGVDFTPSSIETAKKYASEAGSSNISFVCSDILEYINKQSSMAFDLVVFTEAAFFLPSYKEVLEEIYRILKPGGVAVISFRSQWFDILYSIRARKWDSADMAVKEREGYLWGPATWFSWQTKDDIEKCLTPLGFKEIDYRGIGVCSGIEGDSLEAIARPSLLEDREMVRLMDIENKLSVQYADCGRYILAIARK